MSPYQHIFSTNAVLNVWRNLRTNNRDPNDLLLTLQYHPDDVRTRRFGGTSGKENAIENSAAEERDGSKRTGVDAPRDGRSIGFVVPWRSMQAQKRELKEKEKELAEALVILAGEVAFTELTPTVQSSLTSSPLIQIRHLCAGLSRQLSRIELQMADNAPFCRGKNLYTGGEIARKFIPPINLLFEQRPVPRRMIFELLLELKDLVFEGMVSCDREVLEWEIENFSTLEELDECILKTLTPPEDATTQEPTKAIEEKEQDERHGANITRKLLKRRKAPTSPSQPWLSDEEEMLYHLESLETTTSAFTHLIIPIDDFCAKSIIYLRRMLDRRTLTSFTLEKKRRSGRCAEYARCMKWAGISWRQGGGCRRGCRNEDEDPESLPSWHSSSRHFTKEGMARIGGEQKSIT